LRDRDRSGGEKDFQQQLSSASERDGNISASPPSGYASPVLSLSEKSRHPHVIRSENNNNSNSPNSALSLSREGSINSLSSKKERSELSRESAPVAILPLQVQLSPRSERVVKRATSPRHEQRSPRGDRGERERRNLERYVFFSF
jgi:hypothetical protein